MRIVSFWNLALLALFGACLGLTPTTFAHSDLTSVMGTIHDPSGAIVPNASVTVRNQATGAERRATTNDSGIFSITNVAAGTYTLIVEATGFKRFAQSGNAVAANVTATL